MLWMKTSQETRAEPVAGKYEDSDTRPRTGIHGR